MYLKQKRKFPVKYLKLFQFLEKYSTALPLVSSGLNISNRWRRVGFIQPVELFLLIHIFCFFLLQNNENYSCLLFYEGRLCIRSMHLHTPCSKHDECITIELISNELGNNILSNHLRCLNFMDIYFIYSVTIQ